MSAFFCKFTLDASDLEDYLAISSPNVVMRTLVPFRLRLTGDTSKLSGTSILRFVFPCSVDGILLLGR